MSVPPRVLAGRPATARPLSPKAMFLKGFIEHPAMVASIIPSSQRLIERMLAPVDWAKVKLFVEYGPGVGTFTRTILERLAPDAMLLAIDTNRDFVTYLRGTIADSRLAAVHGSAADVEAIVRAHGHDQADYALSGLPFSTLPRGVGAVIGMGTAKVLRPGGAFLVYQFSPKVREYLTPNFARVDSAFEWWNIPPARLYWAWK